MTEQTEKQIKDLMQTLADQKIPAVFIASIGDQFIQSRNVNDKVSAELITGFISKSDEMMEATLMQFERMRDLSESKLIEKLENGDTTATADEDTTGGNDTGS